MRVLLPGVLLLVLTGPLAAAPDWAAHPVNEWIKQSPRDQAPAPAFGWEGSGSYDPINRKWIHFGGHDGIPQGFHLFTLDLDSGKWQQHFPPTSPGGVCCIDGAHVFDLANSRFVRFPGGSLGHGYQWSRGVKLKNSAVWLYDLANNQWTNMRPPPYAQFNPREGLGSLNAAATYDPNHELSISFGGQGTAGGTNNLFIYDAYANQLTRLPADNPPAVRDGHGLCYDARNDCLVLFGSQYSSDEKTYVYRYATNRWEAHDLNPRPIGKKLGTYSTIPKMAYDSRNGVCLCITWDTNTGKHESWALDVAKLQWTKLNPPVEAEASMSRARNLSYDAERNVFILETMPKETKGTGPQVWTYRLQKPAEDKRPPAPTGLVAVTDEGKVAMQWEAVAGAKEYHVWRSEAAAAHQTKYEKVATTTKPAYEDASVKLGKITFYRVTAASADSESAPSVSTRSQPRVLIKPVVSVLGADKVEVNWNAHPAKDVAGYHVYRGLVTPRAIQKGTPGAWKDNDPEYAEPTVVEVRDITEIRKLTDKPVTATTFTDAVNLKAEGAAGEYRFPIYAYIIKAVNKLGVESGPSPYALTIPAEPTNLLNREGAGGVAELKWDAAAEKNVTGYKVYKLEGTWNIVRLTDEPIKEPKFTHKGGAGATRYWVTTIDALGQEGQPSSPVWHNKSYKGFYPGEWHQ